MPNNALDVIFRIDHESEKELTNLFNSLMQRAFTKKVAMFRKQLIKIVVSKGLNFSER